MYVALLPHAKRLFSRFEPVTSRLQWSNLTVTPHINKDDCPNSSGAMTIISYNLLPISVCIIVLLLMIT